MAFSVRKAAPFIILGAMLVLLGWWAISRWFTSEEGRIRAMFSQMTSDLDKADGHAFVGHLANDVRIEGVSDEAMALGIHRTIEFTMRQYKRIAADISAQTIKIEKEKQPMEAHVTIRASALAYPADNSPPVDCNAGWPINGRTMFDLFLKKNDHGDWMIHNISMAKTGVE
jgi:hypothetical protein